MLFKPFAISNKHARIIRHTHNSPNAVIDTILQEDGILWPKHFWPRDSLDTQVFIGARGSHGKLLYKVTEHEKGKRVRFEFTSPTPYKGHHTFQLRDCGEGKLWLLHEVECSTNLVHFFLWKLLFQWVHNALIEDAFDCAENYLSTTVKAPPVRTPWRWHVIPLRYFIGSIRLIQALLLRRRP
jgi:hypothetical protein